MYVYLERKFKNVFEWSANFLLLFLIWSKKTSGSLITNQFIITGNALKNWLMSSVRRPFSYVHWEVQDEMSLLHRNFCLFELKALFDFTYNYGIYICQ